MAVERVQHAGQMLIEEGSERLHLRPGSVVNLEKGELIVPRGADRLIGFVHSPLHFCCGIRSVAADDVIVGM